MKEGGFLNPTPVMIKPEADKKTSMGQVMRYVQTALSKHQDTKAIRVLEKAMSPVVSKKIEDWYQEQEAAIANESATYETEVYHSPDKLEEQILTKANVIMIAGQFNTNYKDNAGLLSDDSATTESRKKHFVCPYRLYSARKLEDVESYASDVEDLARRELEMDDAKPVVLLGFSFGGIIAKVVIDKLAKEYPGRLGLVTWHTPLDPEMGFLVRNAQFGELYKAIGYDATHCGDYPVVVLTGSEDGIVPLCTSLNLRETITLAKGDGEPVKTDLERTIKPKANPKATHMNPLASELAVRRVHAALELTAQSAGRFGQTKTTSLQSEIEQSV